MLKNTAHRDSQRPFLLIRNRQSQFGKIYSGNIRAVAFVLLAFSFFGVAMWHSQRVQAASYSSTQSGDWGDPATWGGAGVPTTGDDVTINNPHTVNVSGPQSASNLTVNFGGTVSISTGSVLTISNGTINNNGVISGAFLRTQGSVTFNNNATFDADLSVDTGTTSAYGTFGVAGSADSISVNGGATLRLTSTLYLVSSSGNLTNNGTIDLNGQTFFFGSAIYSSPGTVTGSGNLNFNGVNNGSGTEQTVNGSGTYGSGVAVRILNNTTVSLGTNASTIFTGVTNFQIDFGSTFNIGSNTFTFSGPASGMTFAVFNNSGTVTGTGTFRTQGQVDLNQNNIFTTPLRVVSGTTRTYSTYGGTVTVDAGATLRMQSTLIVNSNLTLNGTIDFNGQTLYFQGATFTQAGALTGSGSFFFNGVNGSSSGTTQNVSGAGTYDSSIAVRIQNNTTVVPANASTAFTGVTNFQIDFGSTLNIGSNTFTFSGPASGTTFAVFNNSGTVTGTGTFRTQGQVDLNQNNTFNVPLQVVSGITRTYGTYSGMVTVNSGATLRMQSTLIVNNNVAGNGTLDLNGQTLYFQGTTFNNSGTATFAGSGNIFFNGVNGSSSGTTQHVAGTATFSSSIAVRILNNTTLVLDGDTQFSSVTIDFGSTLDLTNRTLSLSGPGTPVTNNGTIITTGSTIVYNGTATQDAQTINTDWSYNNLTIDNPAGVNLSTAETIPGRLTLNRGVFNNGSNLTMANNATIARSAGSLSSAPNFAGVINIEYFGTTLITTGLEIPSGNTVNNLTINTTSTVTLSGSLTVNGALTLTSGLVNTGANVLAVGASGSATRTSGYVIGNLRKTFGGATSFTFHVGTANAYSPATADVTAGSGDLTVRANQGKHPVIAGAEALQRYWALTGSGLTANLTFQYLAGDVVGNETNYRVFRYDGSVFTTPTPQAVDVVNHRGGASNISSFTGDWTLAEPGAVYGRLQFVSAPYTIGESGGSRTITVSRTGGNSGIVSINYATTDGTATGGNSCGTAGVDYITQTGTLTWANGDTADKTFSIPVCDDITYENDEAVNITLSNPGGGAELLAPTATTLTITNNDPPPTISITDVYVMEPSAGTITANFTVTKTGSTALPAIVDYSTADGTATAGSDYVAISATTLTFNPEETTKTISVTINSDALAEPAETFFVNLTNPTNATITDNQGLGTITQPVAARDLLITEFRFRGPAGANDEFVEIYNNTDTALTVGTLDGSAGWALAASDSVTRLIIPNGTVIPARGHFLGVNNSNPGGYSLNSYPGGYDSQGNVRNATGDAFWTLDIPDNTGIALFRTATVANFLAAGNRLDAVGFASELNTLYREGAGLPNVMALDVEQSFVRQTKIIGGPGTGRPIDTDVNADDFIAVEAQGQALAASPGNPPPRLGAPGPENLASPIQRNAQIRATLLDPSGGSPAAPTNRYRYRCTDADVPAPCNPNASPQGYLSIRRTYTNNTGQPVTRLRFRVVDISTYSEGTGPSGNNIADLRALSRSGSFPVTPLVGPAVTVQGLTLEQPPNQPVGGGYNASLTAPTVTLQMPLAAVDDPSTPVKENAITVEFLLGIVQTGNFRFFVNVEALP